MFAALATPLFGPEQAPLSGFDPGIRPALRLVGQSETAAPTVPAPPMPPIPGQLCFSWNQLLLSEVEPEPRQPSLLPEPPLWEELVVPRHVRATRGRSRSRRGRNDGADQLRLFA